MTEDGANKEVDAFVNTDPEERQQLAKAIIISEDTEQSTERLGRKDNIDGGENQTEDPEGDDTTPAGSEVDGVYKSDGSPINNVKKNAVYVLGGLGVGVLTMAALYISTSVNKLCDLAESKSIPVQMYFESMDAGAHDALYFDKFLILLEDEHPGAYLSLGVSVIPSSKAVWEEIFAKRTVCRAVIYEVLKKTVSTWENLEETRSGLARAISEALDEVLNSGGVEKVDLYEFLVV